MSVETSADLFDSFMNIVYDYQTSIEVEPRTDYSGRGMYGADCVGFVTDNPTQIAMTVAVVLSDLERDYADNGEDYPYPHWYDLSARSDSMGLSTIVYFPNWQVV